MLEYIRAGYSVVGYSDFKRIRENSNSGFNLVEDGNVFVLTSTSKNGSRVLCVVDKNNAENASILSDIEYYRTKANRAPIVEEVRFYTHDYADRRTWDGETCGDPAAWAAGGVMKHPISQEWVDATGAAMLAAYATPGDPHFQDPVYLFGSANYSINNRYDDVEFKWYDRPLDQQDKVMVAYLDKTTFPSTWKNASNEVIVKYNGTIPFSQATTDTGLTVLDCQISNRHPEYAQPKLKMKAGLRPGTYVIEYGDSKHTCTWEPEHEFVVDGKEYGRLSLKMGTLAPQALPAEDTITLDPESNTNLDKWLRKDESNNWTVDVTSSLWRILPYSGYKIQINQAGISAEQGALLQDGGYLEYQAFIHLEAGDPKLPYGYPSGTYKGKEFVYKSVEDFRYGCNTIYVEPIVEVGNKYPVQTMIYDYEKTIPQLVESSKGMRLDILLRENKKVVNTSKARGAFICLKIESF